MCLYWELSAQYTWVCTKALWEREEKGKQPLGTEKIVTNTVARECSHVDISENRSISFLIDNWGLNQSDMQGKVLEYVQMRIKIWEIITDVTCRHIHKWLLLLSISSITLQVKVTNMLKLSGSFGNREVAGSIPWLHVKASSSKILNRNWTATLHVCVNGWTCDKCREALGAVSRL